MIAKLVFVLLMLGVMFLSFRFISASFKVLESPNYQVKEKRKALEIRSYPNMVVASSRQNMGPKPALRAGFKALFQYISGANETHEGIAMTVPVLQQDKDHQWITSFIMPAKYTLKDLPQARDASIHLTRISKGNFMVLRFSGRPKLKTFQAKLQQLKSMAQDYACQVEEPAFFAIYNAPWSLPFLRRNEVWLRLQKDCQFNSPKD